MSRDPWADDWDDDWTKTTQTKATNSELWSQANARTNAPVDFQTIAPQVAYRPAVKILKRETSAADIEAAANRNRGQATQGNLDKAAREARYKEARERLFGSPTTSPAPDSNGRPNSTASRASDSSKPSRQARGPEQGNRGGFGGRGRGRGQT